MIELGRIAFAIASSVLAVGSLWLISIGSLWLIYKTWRFGQQFEWQNMTRIEILLVSCGRAGIYLFLIPITALFGTLAVGELLVAEPPVAFGLLVKYSAAFSFTGLCIILLCAAFIAIMRKH